MPTFIPTLETITAKDLLTAPVEPLGFTIADILPHGLFVLAGGSKIGKSWLALDMSSAVANGGSLWQFRASQGEVLYLALEDNKKRSQERLNKMSAAYDIDAPTDIHFVYKVQKLGSGLAEQITAFLDAHPQTKLIVIDTLQYIRNSKNSAGTYTGDYADMDALREIISGRELTMLLITHNHKSDDADPLNRVIGSTGLTGAVDGIFVLEKNRRVGSIAKLTIANREQRAAAPNVRHGRGRRIQPSRPAPRATLTPAARRAACRCTQCPPRAGTKNPAPRPALCATLTPAARRAPRTRRRGSSNCRAAWWRRTAKP